MSCNNCHCNPCTCHSHVPPFVPPPAPTGLGCPVCPPDCDPATADTSLDRVLEAIGCFNVPAVGANIDVSIQCSDDWVGLKGCCVIVKDPTQQVTLRIDQVNETLNTLTLHNAGYVNNPAGGTPLVAPCFIMPIGRCPDVGSATDCVNTRLLTDEVFNIPAVGNSTNVRFLNCLNITVGQTLFVQGVGDMRVLSIVSNDPTAILDMETVCLNPGVIVGAVIPSGSYAVTNELCLPQVPAFLALKDSTPSDIDETDPGPPVVPGEIVPWTSEDFDVLSDFDLANDRFSAPFNGIYSFAVGLKIDDAYLDAEWSIGLLKNGTDLLPLVASSLPPTGAEDQRLTAVCLAQLDATDTVEVVIVNPAATANVSVLEGTFKGYLVQRI